MRRNHRSGLERRTGGQDGYTLTEMLVVIAIIGLIAAVLTPSLIGQLGRARVKSANLQLETLSSAVEMFRADVGRYPTQAEGLKALLTEPADVEGWSGPYAKNAKALNDPWGEPVRYEADPETQYRVVSLGGDRKPGGNGTKRDLRAPEAP